MSEQPPSYYDRVFSESPEWSKDVDTAFWAPLWDWATQRLKSAKGILDLGCGPGHLAERIIRDRDDTFIYVGVDFSQVAIDKARARIKLISSEWWPSTLLFWHATVTPDFIRRRRVHPSWTVVATEFLEHVEADLDILEALSSGQRVVATVPRRDSESHVRYFDSMNAVVDRYSGVLDELHVERIGDQHFGLEGVTR